MYRSSALVFFGGTLAALPQDWEAPVRALLVSAGIALVDYVARRIAASHGLSKRRAKRRRKPPGRTTKVAQQELL